MTCHVVSCLGTVSGMPLAAGLSGFLWQVVRARGSVNRASEAVAIDLAQRPVSELTALLRSKSDQHGKAPGVGAMGQMVSGCLHLRDCARPLGRVDDVSLPLRARRGRTA